MVQKVVHPRHMKSPPYTAWVCVDQICGTPGFDSSAKQDTLQRVAEMLMREVPGLAGVIQHRGDILVSCRLLARRDCGL